MKARKTSNKSQINTESWWTRAVGRDLNWNDTSHQLLTLSDWLKGSTSLIHKLDSHWIKVLPNSIRHIWGGQSRKFEKVSMLLMRKAVKILLVWKNLQVLHLFTTETSLKKLKQLACQVWSLPLRLADQAACTWASLHYAIRFQFPGDKVEESVWRIMAGFAFFR